MSEFVTVMQVGDLAPGAMKAVRLGRTFIGIANVDGEFLAFNDTCTHEDASLTEGELFGESVECPLHGAAFCIRTGAVESFPATIPLRTYEVQVVGTDVQINPTPRPLHR